MTANKTQPTPVDPADWLAAVADLRRRAEGQALDALFRQITGWQPRMWGPSIVGYGRYHYRYDSGREGDAPATGFSPRKADLSVYAAYDYSRYTDILSRLGPHRHGAACLYIRRLDQVDMTALEDLIRAGLADLATRHPVFAS